MRWSRLDPARTLVADPQPVQPVLAELLATSRTTADHRDAAREPAPTTVAAARARRARRLVVRTGALSGVLVVSGACVAAATGLIGLHTGFFGSPGMTDEDTSEFYDISSPDLGPMMERYAVDTPLAPGYSLDPLVAQLHALGGLMQEEGIRGEIATWSACTWDRSWLHAHAAGDQNAQERATAVITAVPTWPIVVRTAGDRGVVDPGRGRRRPGGRRRGDAVLRRRPLPGPAMSEDAAAQVEALYRDHGHRVLAYLVRRAACPEDAADVMGEVMVTTWRRREDLPASPDDVPWLFGVARNTLANHRRAAVRRGEVTARLATAVRETAPDRTGATDTSIDVRRALERLDPLDREILTLDVWEGLTSAEIGVVVGMPAATVRSRLLRARRRLRTPLGAGPPHSGEPGPTVLRPAGQPG